MTIPTYSRPDSNTVLKRVYEYSHNLKKDQKYLIFSEWQKISFYTNYENDGKCGIQELILECRDDHYVLTRKLQNGETQVYKFCIYDDLFNPGRRILERSIQELGYTSDEIQSGVYDSDSHMSLKRTTLFS